ncbi:hypothetical protein [Maridesulfovibrio ferrireducens]|uniref:hypothetical protein n=1 Tax=Maridesulfovibrio ferrireducens TaxID=246191 RepID=UPI001A239287|nr:hypothetical protein [Maridesulfovibrio ferrireducens]MBI9111385.1 hypothetical protein [Maridesulfovibrio ferrireducens]
MRNYLLEDIYEEDLKKISKALTDLEFTGGLEGIYYIPVPEDLLQTEQKEHINECGPYFMALEVLEDGLKLELLVRARNKLRCSCVCYATTDQRNHMLDYLDNFINDLEISL